MAKTFKRTKLLRLKPFKNEQKKHGSISRNRAEQKTEAVYSASVFHLSSINISPGHV